MDDGLAEKLFYAFWKPIIDAGYPPPAKWDDLGEAQRTAWQAAAVAARKEFADRVDARVEMLEGANAAWQRESARLVAEAAAVEARIEQHVEGVRAATRQTMANFADVLTKAIRATPGECRAMLADLRDSLRRLSVVS